MDRAQRKSERLAEKLRRVGRRSHEMSVGEVWDTDNTSTMDSDRKAGGRREKQTPRPG